MPTFYTDSLSISSVQETLLYLTVIIMAVMVPQDYGHRYHRFMTRMAAGDSQTPPKSLDSVLLSLYNCLRVFSSPLVLKANDGLTAFITGPHKDVMWLITAVINEITFPNHQPRREPATDGRGNPSRCAHQASSSSI